MHTYDLLTEVPLTTSGGYMKSDVMLVKRNAKGDIQDVIIIENKLSKSTEYTVRQKEGFGAILNGQTQMKVEYDFKKTPQDLIYYFEKKAPISINKNKIYRFYDGGTDNISNVTIEQIIKL